MMRTIRRIMGVAVATVLLAGCTEVELCYSDHPHHAYLDIRYNWAEEYKDCHTDSMRVVAVRPVNILRYGFRVSAKPQDNQGILIYPLEEKSPLPVFEDSENGATLPSGDGAAVDGIQAAGEAVENDRLWVRAGNYNFATYAWDTNVLEVVEDPDATAREEAAGETADEGTDAANDGAAAEGQLPSDMESVSSATGSDFTPLMLSYRHFPVEDPRVTGYAGDWKDYNAYSDYISAGGIPVYYASVNHVEVPLARDGSQPRVTVEFTPQMMSQKVTFRFVVEKTPDMVVDSIVGEIAGVPSTIELTQGELLAGKTYKTLFKPAYPALANLGDSIVAARLECEGSVWVTGIVRSYSNEMKTGPGILQIALYTHVDEQDTGRRPVKVFRTGINLYHTLKENPLLDWNEETERYRQTCHEAVLEISDVLSITKDAVLNSGSSATGLDYWEEGSVLELDI